MTAKPTKLRGRKNRRGQAAAQWVKSADWLIKTITDLHESPTGHGLKWTAGMIAHYKRQYDELCKKVPTKCAHSKACYDVTFARILAEYKDYLK